MILPSSYYIKLQNFYSLKSVYLRSHKMSDLSKASYVLALFKAYPACIGILLILGVPIAISVYRGEFIYHCEKLVSYISYTWEYIFSVISPFWRDGFFKYVAGLTYLWLFMAANARFSLPGKLNVCIVLFLVFLMISFDPNLYREEEPSN